MLLIGGLFGTSILVLLLATLFGDVSLPIAGGLASGLFAVAIGLLLPTWPLIVRNINQPMQATHSARQFGQPATTVWMWVAGLALTISGGIVTLTFLRALVGAP